MAEINIRLAGKAGQGLHTTGNLLVQAFSSLGLYVISSQSYMSRVRGGLNWYDIRISDRELYDMFRFPDILVALSEEALNSLASNVTDSGVVLYDGESERDDIAIMKFTDIAKEVSGTPLMANTVAAGAVLTTLGYETSVLADYLRKQFSKVSDSVVEKNLQCLHKGVEIAMSYKGKVSGPPLNANNVGKAIYNGAQAMALSVARSGLKFIAAYPMTPGTSTFLNIIKLSDKYGIVSEQAEDEIAAINMICGATAAGIPAMATTSGGGFALMGEGVSLAGMMELPILVMVSQRPGPATGLPTRTAQQDLNLVIYAGHGEFPKMVYAPGTIEQCYHVSRKALQVAHKYQSPAFILADQYLVDSEQNIPVLDDSYDPIDRYIVNAQDDDYCRYQLTESGVSPRAVFGGNGWVIYDSDEHTEDGHITEDLDIAVKMHDKRMAKNKGILQDFIMPQWYGEDNPENILVCWGSTYGPVRSAIDILKQKQKKVAMLHFSQVWPVDVEKVKEEIARHCAKPARMIFVEGNGTGQFAALCRQIALVDQYETCLKYNGMAFTGEEIAERIVL